MQLRRKKIIGRSSLHFPKMAKVIAFTPWWAPEDRKVRNFLFTRLLWWGAAIVVVSVKRLFQDLSATLSCQH